MGHSAGTGVSLFGGGLCSQTLPPSNYVHIELSARLDESPALGCFHGLSFTLEGSDTGGNHVHLHRNQLKIRVRNQKSNSSARNQKSTIASESRLNSVYRRIRTPLALARMRKACRRLHDVRVISSACAYACGN